MHRLKVCSTADWEISVDISDDRGPLSLIGSSLIFGIKAAHGEEIAEVSTATGHITFLDAANGKIKIVIARSDRSGFVMVSNVRAYGDILRQTGQDDIEWLGRLEFDILLGAVMILVVTSSKGLGNAAQISTITIS